MQPATVILYSSQLTDASLAVIGRTCKGLTSIDISDNNNITDVGIASLTQGCFQLQSIDIGGCDQLTDASLAVIGETYKGLTSIDMSLNNNITDDGVANLFRRCGQLMTVRFAQCEKVTWQQWEKLARDII